MKPFQVLVLVTLLGIAILLNYCSIRYTRSIQKENIKFQKITNENFRNFEGRLSTLELNYEKIQN